MIILKKLEISDNILKDLINLARIKTKKIIVFDNRIFEKIKEIKPKEINNKKIIPIKKSKKIFIEDEYNIYIAYDSLNDSFSVVCNRISSDLYLLKGFRYKNNIYEEDIEYYMTNNFIKKIILSQIKKKNNSLER